MVGQSAHAGLASTVDSVERCDECGFDYDATDWTEVGARVRAAAAATAALLADATDVAATRPEPDRWSALEYAAHVRDVLITIRDRLVIGLVEDDPGFKPMYRDQRVAFGLYAGDTVDAVAPEVVAAAAMLARLFDAIDPDALARPVQYGFPDPERRTLLWMGRQAVHECEHHLDDMRENVARLGG